MRKRMTIFTADDILVFECFSALKSVEELIEKIHLGYCTKKQIEQTFEHCTEKI